MNLEEIIKGFIDGRFEMEDVIASTNLNIYKIQNIIKKYYEINKITMPEEVNQRIKSVYGRIQKLYELNNTYSDIAKIYKCSVPSVKKILADFSDSNQNIYFSKLPYRSDEELKIAEEIYELKKQGLSYSKIYKKYNFSKSKVVCLLKEHCIRNDLSMPPPAKRIYNKKEINLSLEDMYILILRGLSYFDVSLLAGCSDTLVRKNVIRYCKDNNLEYPSRTFSAKKNLPINEIFELKKSGMTYDGIASIYGCCSETIRKKIRKYSLERFLIDLQLIIDNKTSDNIYIEENEISKKQKSLV